MDDVEDSTPRIRFAPSILKRLGEELNPNIDQGLLELVKNAYDADALHCTIELNPDGTDCIIIQDDGRGMSADEIINGWLILGASAKRSSERTHLGRVPAGNKGLGRLAALRIGHRAVMTSATATGPAFTVNLDWDLFDKASTVDEVSVDVQQSRATGTPGTRIEIHNLRHPIGRIEARRLARALVLLADPFSDTPNSFQPTLLSAEYADLAEQVAHRYFDQADFHLSAEVKDGRARATISDWRGNVLWTAEHEEILRARPRSETEPAQATTYQIPNTFFDFWVFILSQETFSSRPVQLSAVREWLQSFGGVHVYVNDLRVAPYGNAGNDWLDLNLSRARSPEDRPSTNTAIGRLRVEDDKDALPQKTDRTGFIETGAFDDLRRFATDALDWLARKRRELSEARRQQKREDAARNARASSEAVRNQIRNIADEGKRLEVEKAFDSYERSRDQENETLRREIQLYRTLSTAGITAATFAHESTGNSLKRISILSNAMKGMLERDVPELYQSKYASVISRVGSAVESLNVLTSATTSLINQDKRRIGRVIPDQIVLNIIDVFEPFLRGRDVLVASEIPTTRRPFLRGSEAALESIVTNLLNNSLSSFERTSGVERKIQLRTASENGNWILHVDDSGPGITDIDPEEIWQAGVTQRPGGTGLGLTIVRDTVLDLNGTVEVQPHGELGGAQFTVSLPALGVVND
ncbi:ATP-binding protein [Amnibacterium setariae]|uniref:histidine kinase n=1 Tax=Amnibacterium setariae TaxID=2306585 RepID=A0A3A1U1S5_9MICO|nr:sensor histidine kinase [Amnibacterium setariae]RIX28406.1 GHKL domain-containing protein [Amnibacterium setariae]